ncbi:MAG: hypothetical protein FJ148_12195 [Deltaproteobacteria bacterium]|nr:hypothetical protein [Deltaproteobacteria bacterium]
MLSTPCPRPASALRALLVLSCAAALAACGGSSGGGSGPTTPGTPSCEAGESFDSTFEAIQEVVFEKHGCTQQVCHGSAAAGGLNLSPDVAYANLFEVKALGSALNRVAPGDKDRSYLWLKLAASTRPGTVEIGGAPMPLGLPALSENELEAVRLWIYAGAPETGTVLDTEDLLDACLPEPKPITIEPLDPPPAGEGVQIVMPQWPLPARSEHEICFASYFDVTDQVPEQYRDPSGRFLRFDREDLRQDPQSHHLILNYSIVPVENIHDPAFGDWTCRGGGRDGEACEPTDATSCGSGLCAAGIRDGFACTGYGPPVRGGLSYYQIGGAQQAQQTVEYVPGVFAQIPMKGILYWNSHAFNLTGDGHDMNARLNYWFAPPDRQRTPVQGVFDVNRIFSANAEPYTTQTLCHDHVLPQGARLFNLSSHTHRRGKHFTVDLPDGSRIYESFVYNDPVDQDFDPPLAFDSPDPRERTLHFCSLYNNGVNEDGSPDTEFVTRFSRLPASVFVPGVPGRCRPKACTAGQVGAACEGVDDDATCDSSPGAGDGECDACRITGGESTENEMFILLGNYFIEDLDGAGAATPLLAAPSGTGRSDFVGVAVPAARGCASSHGGHGAAATDAQQAGHS